MQGHREERMVVLEEQDKNNAGSACTGEAGRLNQHA
jgi:hypothetical protein